MGYKAAQVRRSNGNTRRENYFAVEPDNAQRTCSTMLELQRSHNPAAMNDLKGLTFFDSHFRMHEACASPYVHSRDDGRLCSREIFPFSDAQLVGGSLHVFS